MQQRKLYEYAVIRIMPRVEREEFLNVGVVLYCKEENFLQAKYVIDKDRIAAFCSSCDIPAAEAHLVAFEKICIGSGGAGPISKLPAAARFRWLTATRSTVIQTSKVHPGFCISAAETLEKLFSDFAG